jgi:hypothetical protein
VKLIFNGWGDTTKLSVFLNNIHNFENWT